MQLYNKLSIYKNLLRLNHPTGFMLLFWPCTWGISLDGWTLDFYLIILFFIGSIIMRASGCVINDIFDRDIDKKVERTKNRPIASGHISIIEALIILAFLLVMGLGILLQLDATAIKVGCLSLLFVIFYPLMKRITFYPQIFLGVTFNFGVLIGYAATNNTVTLHAFLLYLAAIFWTVGYDTIYGYQDIKHDKKIGIKSTSIRFEKHAKLFISLMYICFTAILLFALYIKNNSISFSTSFFAFLLYICFLWQIFALNIKSPTSCMRCFKFNNFIGLLIFLLINIT